MMNVRLSDGCGICFVLRHFVGSLKYLKRHAYERITTGVAGGFLGSVIFLSLKGHSTEPENQVSSNDK